MAGQFLFVELRLTLLEVYEGIILLNEFFMQLRTKHLGI